VIVFEKTVAGVSQRALARFAREAQRLARVPGDVAVLIADNRRLRALNRSFRHKDKPTDVLSFPRRNGRGLAGGDIAISADIARENAARYGHTTADELKILVLHGMLHLAGYDHETDNGRMEKTEARLRSRLKLPASLIQRSLIARTLATHSPKPRARTARSSAARGPRVRAKASSLRKRRSPR
jgi:probable rRNA maturation factor